jgi:hypothetical protein
MRFDKVRCSFCKRGKFNWWPYEYPEAEASYLSRATDAQVATAFGRWHAVKSPTCPRVPQLQVDALELSEEQRLSVYDALKSSIAAAR